MCVFILSRSSGPSYQASCVLGLFYCSSATDFCGVKYSSQTRYLGRGPLVNSWALYNSKEFLKVILNLFLAIVFLSMNIILMSNIYAIAISSLSLLVITSCSTNQLFLLLLAEALWLKTPLLNKCVLNVCYQLLSSYTPVSNSLTMCRSGVWSQGEQEAPAVYWWSQLTQTWLWGCTEV